MPYWAFLNKNGLVGYFWARKLEKYCHIGNLQPQICLFPKCCEKTTMSKFGTKIACFGYFWAGI